MSDSWIGWRGRRPRDTPRREPAPDPVPPEFRDLIGSGERVIVRYVRMLCPRVACRSERLKVVKTWRADGNKMRLHNCLDCGLQFWSLDPPEPPR